MFANVFVYDFVALGTKIAKGDEPEGNSENFPSVTEKLSQLIIHGVSNSFYNFFSINKYFAFIQVIFSNNPCGNLVQSAVIASTESTTLIITMLPYLRSSPTTPTALSSPTAA